MIINAVKKIHPSPGIEAYYKEDKVWHIRFEAPGLKSKKPINTGLIGTEEDLMIYIKDHGFDRMGSSKIYEKLNPGELKSLLGTVSKRIIDTIPEFDEWMTVAYNIKTRKRYLQAVKQWMRYFDLQTRFPHSIKIEEMDCFFNGKHLNIGISPRRMRCYGLKAYLKFCVEKGYLETAPSNLRLRRDLMNSKDKETHKFEPMTPIEFKSVVRHIEDLLKTEDIKLGEARGKKWIVNEKNALINMNKMVLARALIVLSYATGLRYTDVCHLEWECFSKKGYVIMWTTKRDRRVQIPTIKETIDEFIKSVHGEKRNIIYQTLHVNGTLVELALKTIKKTHDIYLFPEVATSFHKFQRYRVYVNEYIRTTGVRNKSFHSLRVGYMHRMKEADLSINDIGRLVGHSSTGMTEQYLMK